MTGSGSRLPDEVGDLTLHTTQIGQRTVLAASGDIDLVTAQRLEEAADAALDKGTHDLWIDLSDVDFIDSTGIHVLLQVRGRAMALNRQLAVICPVGPIRRAFGLTGLDEVLPLYTSRDEAHRHG
ncbi:MAG TPA: STAS domain-containing protein [Solirubrobacteraceae bacterium]|nr:STAS domain-containing protein [Solirubrobacteraceae bacterium]